MRLTCRLSPVQIASISLAGAVLLYAEATILGLLHARPQSLHYAHSLAQSALLACKLSLPLIAGCCAMVWGWGALEKGVAADLWPEATLKHLHKVFSSPTAVWLARSSIAAGALLYFADLLQIGAFGSHHVSGIGGFAYCFIVPWITLQRLRRCLAPAKPLELGRTWTEHLKPIVSQHWGE